MARKLTLKRDVLQELSTADLDQVVGGGTTGCVGGTDTMYSCYTYISCHIIACLPTFKTHCIEIQTEG